MSSQAIGSPHIRLGEPSALNKARGKHAAAAQCVRTMSRSVTSELLVPAPHPFPHANGAELTLLPGQPQPAPRRRRVQGPAAPIRRPPVVYRDPEPLPEQLHPASWPYIYVSPTADVGRCAGALNKALSLQGHAIVAAGSDKQCTAQVLRVFRCARQMLLQEQGQLPIWQPHIVRSRATAQPVAHSTQHPSYTLWPATPPAASDTPNEPQNTPTSPDVQASSNALPAQQQPDFASSYAPPQTQPHLHEALSSSSLEGALPLPGQARRRRLREGSRGGSSSNTIQQPMCYLTSLPPGPIRTRAQSQSSSSSSPYSTLSTGQPQTNTVSVLDTGTAASEAASRAAVPPPPPPQGRDSAYTTSTSPPWVNGSAQQAAEVAWSAGKVSMNGQAGQGPQQQQLRNDWHPQQQQQQPGYDMPPQQQPGPVRVLGRSRQQQQRTAAQAKLRLVMSRRYCSSLKLPDATQHGARPVLLHISKVVAGPMYPTAYLDVQEALPCTALATAISTQLLHPGSSNGGGGSGAGSGGAGGGSGGSYDGGSGGGVSRAPHGTSAVVPSWHFLTRSLPAPNQHQHQHQQHQHQHQHHQQQQHQQYQQHQQQHQQQQQQQSRRVVSSNSSSQIGSSVGSDQQRSDGAGMASVSRAQQSTAPAAAQQGVSAGRVVMPGGGHQGPDQAGPGQERPGQAAILALDSTTRLAALHTWQALVLARRQLKRQGRDLAVILLSVRSRKPGQPLKNRFLVFECAPNTPAAIATSRVVHTPLAR